MEKKERILYCYSQEKFDELMENLGWKEPPEGFSTVSICSPWNEHFEHWFKPGTPNNYNIDCDDVVRPFWWDKDLIPTYGKDYYDIAEEMYLNGKVKESNDYFNYYREDKNGRHIDLKMFNYEQAFLLASWIDVQIVNGHDNFYVHCAAGMSRSQAIVRYIIDVYTDYDWKTRKENPCDYYNNHMLLMLKRAARNLNIL